MSSIRVCLVAASLAMAMLGRPSAGLAQGDSGAGAAGAPTFVYFDRNSAALTSRARHVIDAFAAAGGIGAKKVEVAGGADRTEAADDNRDLSSRRAQAVAAELIRKGVPKAAIHVSTFSLKEVYYPPATPPMGPSPRDRRVVISSN